MNVISHYKETCSQQNCFHPHVQVHGKVNSKIIWISQWLFDQASPLFTDTTNWMPVLTGNLHQRTDKSTWPLVKLFNFFIIIICKKLNMKIYTKQMWNPKIIIHQILCFSVSQTIIYTHRKTINWQNHTWTHTSKSTSPQQLTAHAGPSMDSTFVLDMS